MELFIALLAASISLGVFGLALWAVWGVKQALTKKFTDAVDDLQLNLPIEEDK